MTTILRISLAFVLICGFARQAEAQNVQTQNLTIVLSNVDGMNTGSTFSNCVAGESWIPNPVGGHLEDAVYISGLDLWLVNGQKIDGFVVGVDVDHFLGFIQVYWGPFKLIFTMW